MASRQRLWRANTGFEPSALRAGLEAAQVWASWDRLRMYRAAENFPWPNPLFQPGRWRWRAKSTFWGRKQASFGHGRAYYFLYSEEKGLSVNCCAMHQEIFEGGTAGRWLLRHYSKVPAWAGSYDNLPARQTNYLAQHERQQGEYYKQHRVNKHLLKGTKSRCGGYDVIAAHRTTGGDADNEKVRHNIRTTGIQFVTRRRHHHQRYTPAQYSACGDTRTLIAGK